MFDFLKSKKPKPAETAEHSGAEKPTLSWSDRFKSGVLSSSIRALFSSNPKLNDELIDDLETCLLQSDVGVKACDRFISPLRQKLKRREFENADALLQELRAQMKASIEPIAQSLFIDPLKRPFVILTVGVNGVGKTTTIGKLARFFQLHGQRVMLAAGDTFRAAAVEQLKTWGERNKITVIAQGQDADSASVIFDALQAAQAKAADVLIADTAGRLHTQQGLMAELGKVARVMKKLDDSAPHEILMVIDGTTGQNAISQVRQFSQAVPVSGLVITKLDGSAKGGIVFALASEFGIPIRFIGTGESADDLQVFDAEQFVDALLPTNLQARNG